MQTHTTDEQLTKDIRDYADLLRSAIKLARVRGLRVVVKGKIDAPPDDWDPQQNILITRDF